MTRTEYLQLTDLSLEAMKSLDRRNQLPAREGDRGAGKDGAYDIGYAFFTLLTLRFSEPGIGCSRNAAREVVVMLPSMMYRYWPEIGATAADLNEGRPVQDEILCGRIILGGHFEPLPFCEPASKLGALIQEHGPVVDIVATSASRVMALLLERSAQHDIKVHPSEFNYRSDEPAARPHPTPQPRAAQLAEAAST